MQPLAAGGINNIRVRRRHRDGSYRPGGLVVKDRLPGAAVIVGLPDSAVAYANVKHAGLAGHAGDGARASATIGPDGAPVERLEEIRGDRGQRGGLGKRGSARVLARSLLCRPSRLGGRGLLAIGLLLGERG
jgi:hypothetical protein